MRSNGVIKSWNDERGFGFIELRPGGPPFWVALVYLLASLVTFLVYAMDKSYAERGEWRTPEGTLHILSLAGGWPGALLAQQLLRHKSAKTEFRSVFWATVVMNVAAFLLLCTPLARSLLSTL